MELLSGFSGRSFSTGRKAKYDWNLWLKPGQIVRLTKGVDFDMKIETFRIYLYQRASIRGMKVETHVFGDAIEFRVLEN